MKNLHPDDRRLFAEVEAITREYAKRYRLPLKKVTPVTKLEAEYSYGYCSKWKGHLEIRVRPSRYGRWMRKRDLAYQIVDTIAHELAHLRFSKHSTNWLIFSSRMLSDMAKDGVLDRIKKLCDRKS